MDEGIDLKFWMSSDFPKVHLLYCIHELSSKNVEKNLPATNWFKYLLFFLFFYIIFSSGVSFPLYPEIFYIITMILQRIRIIVGDAGFEPGTCAPEVWSGLVILIKICKKLVPIFMSYI